MQIKITNYLQNNTIITVNAVMYLVREVQINHLLLTQAPEDQVIQYQIVHDMVR